MSEAATATPAAPAAATPAPAATPSTPSAGATLQSVPAGSEWANSFKSPELKNYVLEKKFTDPEQLAERYQNLEKLRGVPEDRLLKLPEKMEGDEARAVWEKLGAPKEPKGYEIPRDEKASDVGFADWAESAFHKNNLTKAQAQGVAQLYQERIATELATRQETLKNSLSQADTALKKEWGAQYDANLNIAKQGVKILGLDAKTLDLLEMTQGREILFKNLQRIGVSVGESNFIPGQEGTPPAATPEQAQAQIKTLMQDQKFVKKINKGDAEALKTWSELNQRAFPGEKTLG